MKIRSIILLTFILLNLGAGAQMLITATSQLNTNCHGDTCHYTGPPLLINEVMVNAMVGDGSLYGQYPSSTDSSRGEWIEFYNPNRCDPVDVSCFAIGNNAYDDNLGYGGAYEFPPGTIVPAGGFLIIRGIRAAAVPSNLLFQNGGKTIELVLTGNAAVCLGGGNRFWLPDAGGWLALYDPGGLAIDAISWDDTLNFNPSLQPCNPAGPCSFSGQYPSYSGIPSTIKQFIDYNWPVQGMTYRRIPDGGPWVLNSSGTPTYGTNNGPPVNPNACNGSATVTISGGTTPYIITWDDPYYQMTPTAVNLCAGTYCVTVSDAMGLIDSVCVEVHNYRPNVSVMPFPGICQSAPEFIMNSGSPPGGIFSGPGISGNIFHPQQLGVGTYQVVYYYINSDSCYNRDTTSISVLPLPQIFTVTGGGNVCGNTIGVAVGIDGSETGVHYTLVRDAIILSGNKQGTGSPLAFGNQKPPGNYTVYAIDDTTGCMVKMPGSALITSQSIGSINLGDSLYLCNDSILLDAGYFPPAVPLHWQDGSSQRYFTVRQPGSYWVYAGDSVCNSSDSVRIKQCSSLWVPNVFTPNGDEINDRFLPKITGDINRYSIDIFNRWGRVVYRSVIPGEGWDGTQGNHGSRCADGVYYYVITYSAIKSKKGVEQYRLAGSVTLIR